jgi:hypothetical protein
MQGYAPDVTSKYTINMIKIRVLIAQYIQTLYNQCGICFIPQEMMVNTNIAIPFGLMMMKFGLQML